MKAHSSIGWPKFSTSFQNMYNPKRSLTEACGLRPLALVRIACVPKLESGSSKLNIID